MGLPELTPAESIALDVERVLKAIDGVTSKHADAIARLDRGHGYIASQFKSARMILSSVALGLAPDVVDRYVCGDADAERTRNVIARVRT